MTAINSRLLRLTTRPRGRSSHGGRRRDRKRLGGGANDEGRTRGYEGLRTGRGDQLTGSPDGDNTELRRSIHGLSDTTTSNLTKSQPAPTYSDNPGVPRRPDLLVTPSTTSSPAGYSPRSTSAPTPHRAPLLRSPRSYRSRSAVHVLPSVFRTIID